MMQDSLQSPVITSGLFLPAHSPPGVLLGLLWLGAPVPGRMLRWRQQAPQGVAPLQKKKPEPGFLDILRPEGSLPDAGSCSA